MVGLIALVAALAGTAIALPGKNSVDSGDIKKNAVRGKDAKESTFGTVPNAETVAGTQVSSFFIQVQENQPSEEFEFGGVNVTGNCASGVPDLDASNTSGQTAQLQITGNGGTGAFAAEEVPFTSGSAASLSAGLRGNSTAHAIFADGTVVTIDSAWSDNDPDEGEGCNYWGRILSG
jgi:hypothetical protein